MVSTWCKTKQIYQFGTPWVTAHMVNTHMDILGYFFMKIPALEALKTPRKPLRLQKRLWSCMCTCGFFNSLVRYFLSVKSTLGSACTLMSKFSNSCFESKFRIKTQKLCIFLPMLIPCLKIETSHFNFYTTFCTFLYWKKSWNLWLRFWGTNFWLWYHKK